MKKTIITIISIISLILISTIIILSTIGIETKKFNNLISKKINQSNKNIDLKFDTIKFKLDTREISLFLETSKPQIIYRSVIIPVKNIKVYIDFISLIKSKPKIKKINLALEELDIGQLKKLIITMKPSNFKSLVANNINQGKLISDIEFYLDENNLLKNFIARGKVLNLEVKLIDNLIIKKTNLSFFADKTDILIKNIFGELDNIKLADGDLRVKLSPEISLQSNFLSILNYNVKSSDKHTYFINKFPLAENIKNLKAEFNNDLRINFDKTYKVKNYSFNNNGIISEAIIKLKDNLKSDLIEKDINSLSFIDSKISTNFSAQKNKIDISGKYSLMDGDFLNFNVKSFFKKNILNLETNFKYKHDLHLEFINYHKSKDSIADFSFNLKKSKDKFVINKLDYSEKNNIISVDNLNFDNSNLLSFKKISVNTSEDGEINNDFSIFYGKKIKINGSKFDATNLPKIISKKGKNNFFSKINREIEVDFKNIKAPVSENLKNFKLIGLIEKGKFTKISSKGDFGNNNFLDISMKQDKKNQKKYLEIYSDLPKPLLTEINFFKGLAEGKLLYSSIIDKNSSNSKLKIENFKMINAPGMVKLLSLADLGGLADLAQGEGLSFDTLEINMNEEKNFLKINEILALGPSISVLMDGYRDQNGLVSLRGTLVPAKNLNKLISKIPLIGNIVIPKEVGEGLFGISFKIKGPPGKIKTTINPIKTLTPRFIQKILEKNKNVK